MSYARIEQLLEYLPQAKLDSPTVNLLQSIQERAYEIVNEALTFEFTDYVPGTKDVWAIGRNATLDIPAHEAGSVESVALVTGRGTAGETVTTLSDWLEEDDGTLYYDPGWLDGAWYRVTASFGLGPAPASVVEVELEIAVNIWRSRDAASFGTVVGAEGQGAVSYNRALTWAQRSILEGVRAKYLGVCHA